MKWILIFWTASMGFNAGAGGPASATFETEDACHNAARVVSNRWNQPEKNFICVPAGGARSTVQIPQGQ